ncbi:conserved hypothetical protein [Frankia canadensis]|uniref:Uncharacterized protein n=1 Tax=Frankia canadensis TaxID=1836972 RepID=A0A2I2KI71_9ACTN|nr:conserved hypothetical protein [Frankia canadensis]SOU52655.1 conserved hypothetical protein [Frankia canadensis]
MLPFSVDGLIVAASMTMLADRRAGLRRSWLSYGLLGLGGVRVAGRERAARRTDVRCPDHRWLAAAGLARFLRAAHAPDPPCRPPRRRRSGRHRPVDPAATRPDARPHRRYQHGGTAHPDAGLGRLPEPRR